MVGNLRVSRLIALCSLITILGLVNLAILDKERHLKTGEMVFLELAPVDPRSLMQGDYMALRFQISNDTNRAFTQSEQEKKAFDGYLIAELDDNRVATFKAIYDSQILSENEILLQFRVRNRKIKFATNAFFFQEGHAELYESAEYGLFRVNKKGELLLTSLHDKDLSRLGRPDQVVR